MHNPIKSKRLIITSKYGDRTFILQGKKVHGFHHGIDLFGDSYNDEIQAFEDGKVTAVNKVGSQYGRSCYVRIKHSNGLYTLYHHMKTNSIVVNVGDVVKKGQKLGIIGTTGRSTGVHLHFQIDRGSSSSSINPYDYIFKDKKFEGSKNLIEYTDEELANMVLDGYFGNGDVRKKALKDRYSNVQHIVNERLSGKKTLSSYTDTQLAKMVISGKFGNGDARKKALKERYSNVQKIVNRMLK